MKRVFVATAGAGGQNVHERKIGPGTTAKTILESLGFKEGVLSSAGAEGRPFAAGDDVYEAVSNESKLFASEAATVGRR